jgi:hypothetical protein
VPVFRRVWPATMSSTTSMIGVTIAYRVAFGNIHSYTVVFSGFVNLRPIYPGSISSFSSLDPPITRTIVIKQIVMIYRTGKTVGPTAGRILYPNLRS